MFVITVIKNNIITTTFDEEEEEEEEEEEKEEKNAQINKNNVGRFETRSMKGNIELVQQRNSTN